MKTYPLAIILLATAHHGFADYVVDRDLGVLPVGRTSVSGTTARSEIDPGPPPVFGGGNNNSEFVRDLTFSDYNYGNEIVYRLEVEQPSVISLTSEEISGDPDFFLVDSLGTTFDSFSGKITATGGIGAVFLDEDPPFTDRLAVVDPGVYYLAVEHFDGFDGDVIPGDATFTLTITVASASPLDLSFDLGHVARSGTPFTIDTFGSAINTELALYNAIGNLLNENDDAGDGLQSELVIDPGLSPGTYYVVLAGHDTAFGNNFSIGAGGETGDWVLGFPPSTFSPFGTESGTTDDLFPSTESQIFSFTIADAPSSFIDLGELAEVGESFTLDTLGSSFDTQLGLYEKEGFLIAFNDDILAGAILESELIIGDGLPSGEYFIAISGWPSIFGDGFLVFPDPEFLGTESGIFVLNHPVSNGSARTTGNLADGAQQWLRFTVGSGPPDGDAIRVTSIDFNPTTQAFTVAWDSTEPGPFNIRMGAAEDLANLDGSTDGLLDLVLTGATSPVTVPLPPELQGGQKVFLQVSE